MRMMTRPLLLLLLLLVGLTGFAQEAPVSLKVPAETALDSLLKGIGQEMKGETQEALTTYLDQLEASPHAPASLAVLQRVARLGVFNTRRPRTLEVLNNLARNWPDVDPHARMLSLRILADMAQLDGSPESMAAANRDLGKISRAWVTPPSSFTPVVDTLEAWSRPLPSWPKPGGKAKLLNFREGFISPPEYLLQQPGPTHAASAFFVPAKTKVWMILRGTDSSKLWLDGKDVVTLDWIHSHQPDHREALVEVSPGWHRIDVWFLLEGMGDWSDILLLSEEGKPLEFEMLPEDGRLPAPRGRMLRHLGSIPSPSLGWARDRSGEEGRLLEALLWRALDNTEESHLVFRNMTPQLPQSRFLYADGLVHFPGYLPYREAAGQARGIFQDLLQADQDLALVRFRLADLLSEEDEGLTSLDLLEQVVKERPDNPEWLVPLFGSYARLGWELEAREVLLKGLEKFPDHTMLLKAALSYFTQRGDLEWTTFCATRIHDLEPLADEYGEFLVWLERRDEALEYYRNRIEVLSPADDHDRRTVLSVLLSLDRFEEALAWMRAELKPLNPDNPDYQAIEARLLDNLSRNEEADAIRARLMEQHPEERAIRDLESLRQGHLPFEDYRTSAEEVIAQRPDPAVFSGADGVYLLDFGITRFEKSGAQISRYHQVHWVLTKNGVDQMGELTLPPGARPIVVRTIKQDGTSLVPEDLGAKGAISLPGLEPGDFIEVEYTTTEAGGAHGPGSTSNTSAFVFQSIERPFWITHFVVQVPEDVEADIITSNLPKPAEKRSLEDGFLEYSWRYVGLPRLMAEPQTANHRHFVPWVEAGFGVEWTDIQRQIINHVADKSPWTPLLARELEGIVGERKGQEAIDSLVSWLLTEVEGEEVSTMTDPTYTVLGRRGFRLGVVAAWLQQHGVDFQWVFLRNKRILQGLPSTAGYGLPALRYRLSGKSSWRWLTLASQFAPADFIPEAYRGGEAMVCELGAPVKLKIAEDQGRGVNADSSEGTVIVTEDGGVKVESTMTFSTGNSMNLRRALRPIPPDQLDKVMEQFLGSRHESGVLLDASVSGLDDREGQVAISYKWYYGSGLRDLEPGKVLLKSPVFSLDLAAGLASLSQRKLPLEVGSANTIIDRWSLELPEGWRVSEAPQGKGRNKGNAYDWTLTENGERKWQLYRKVYLEGGVVKPEAYGDFAGFLRELGALEEKPLILTTP